MSLDVTKNLGYIDVVIILLAVAILVKKNSEIKSQVLISERDYLFETEKPKISSIYLL